MTFARGNGFRKGSTHPTGCFAIAAQVFVQTGVFAQSYAMVGLIGAVLGLLALMLARVWR
ncbi:hypothetical protein [Bradyrhizobium liaoningense]|uniref:hypothetical protein n=1 Tax=Bradyrhizobium liaoningense TaxID=43992 RepID=UPI001BAB04D4|nr:hypothetical protein [Bradyrhizobium liaoningense]MBR0705995.1 hypothetical protein [Bradyrhizobium liaoningense]